MSNTKESRRVSESNCDATLKGPNVIIKLAINKWTESQALDHDSGLTTQLEDKEMNEAVGDEVCGHYASPLLLECVHFVCHTVQCRAATLWAANSLYGGTANKRRKFSKHKAKS